MVSDLSSDFVRHGPILVICGMRSADVFPVVASLLFGGREATTGNMSAVRRLSDP